MEEPKRRAPKVRGAVLARCAVVLLALAGGCGEDHAPTLLPTYDAQGRAAREMKQPASPPSLVLVVIDTLRGDALPLDVAARPHDSTHPMRYLTTLAERGVSFAHAAAAAPWTLPSMTSLLTGLQPSAHGLTEQRPHWKLAGDVPTFAEVLHNTYGYETAAFVDSPWFVGPDDTILQGFQRKETSFTLQALDECVRGWAATRDRTRPFFLLLHTYDVHAPYGAENHPWPRVNLPVHRPGPDLLRPDADPAALFRACYLDAALGEGLSRQRGTRLGRELDTYSWSGWAGNPDRENARALAADLRAAYWGGVRWTDSLLQSAVASLEERGLLDNTLLVVTSDHGEAFGEHGMLAHGRQLYDEIVHVPLVMKGPAPFRGGLVVQGSVGLVDILPTYMDWVGLAPLQDVEGRSALSLISGEDPCRPVISEERLTPDNTGAALNAVRISARTPRWKYIVTYEPSTGSVLEEAYDLLFDAEEKNDLAGGSGRLPLELVLDPCICPAIQAVRARIWDRTSDAGRPVAIPYGAAPRGPAAPPPSPCRSDDT